MSIVPSCSNTIMIKKSFFVRLRFIGIPFFARSRSPFQVLARQADEGGGWPFKTHISPSTLALFRLFEPFEAAQGGEKLPPSLPTMPEGFVHISYFSSAAVALLNSSTQSCTLARGVGVKIKDICVVFCKCFFYICGMGRGVACHFCGNNFDFFVKSFGVKLKTNSVCGAAQKYSGFRTVTAP